MIRFAKGCRLALAATSCVLLTAVFTLAQPVKAVKDIPVGKGPDALFLTPAERYLYVANVEDTMVTVIDTHSDRVVKTLDTVDYPWGFSRLDETSLVAVSGWAGGVDLIDFRKHRIIKSRRFSQHLGGIVATSGGKYLYVVLTDANRVWKLDARRLEVIDSLVTGEGPDGIGLSGDDRMLYVTNTKEGTISVFDLKTGKVQKITTGGKPELVHSDHKRTRLYISNFHLGKIHILDAIQGRIIAEISGIDGPEEAVLSPDEKRLYVVSFNGSRVIPYDPKRRKPLGAGFVTGKKPIGVVALSGRHRIYVTNYGDNTVRMISFEPGR